MDRMDLKGKLRTFISDSRQKLLPPQGAGEEAPLSLLLPPLSLLDRGGLVQEDREVDRDPLADQEVLDSLDPVFYSEDSDPSLHILSLLGDRLLLLLLLLLLLRDVASVENAPNSGAFLGAHEKQA